MEFFDLKQTKEFQILFIVLAHSYEEKYKKCKIATTTTIIIIIIINSI